MSIYSMAGTKVEQVTLTGNLPYTLPVGLAPNRVHPVVFTQDATGGRTVTFAGQPVVVDLAAGASSTVEFHPVRGGYVALAALAATEVEQVTLTDDLAYTVPSTVGPNRAHSVVFTQDGVGGHTVTFDGSPLSITASGSTVVGFTPAGAGYAVTYPGKPAKLEAWTYAHIGDSLTDRNKLAGAGYTKRRNNIGWMHHVDAALGQRARSVANFAVGGAKTAVMLSTQLPQVLALSPRPTFVTVLGGTNNIFADDSVANITADLGAIYDALLAAGIRVIAGTIPPLSEIGRAHV